MTSLTIAGGVYHEQCIWPEWNQLVGSGGRAAATLRDYVRNIALHSYASPQVVTALEPFIENAGFTFHPTKVTQTVSFAYVHCLSAPTISPSPNRIRRNPPIRLEAPNVLRFGMMEGTAVVKARRCVYDPQSAFDPEQFEDNGSTADELAIVGNRGEIASLGKRADPLAAARSLVRGGARAVVVKAGAEGAYVVEGSKVQRISAFDSGNVWTIGSGDIFAAVFAACWMVKRYTAYRSALIASRAVAVYAGSMALPSPLPKKLDALRMKAVLANDPYIYLAGPFFTVAQRWLIDEARRCLIELGAKVFSPVHDVGHGPAEEVANADLAALKKCHAVFAVLDGLDGGTLFEIGYARALKKPVYAFAQTTSAEELKMVAGSKCQIHSDFVTALHRAAWRS